MNNPVNSFADQFAVYHQLGWYYQWKFRRHLSWIGQDGVSLGILLDFENELKKKSLSFYKTEEVIEEVLTWYYREEHDDRLPNRIQRERLSEMLQIIAIFYNKSLHLHYSYRELILSIINARDDFIRHQETGSGITSEQFRLEAAKAISNLNKDWKKWDLAYFNYIKNGVNNLLSYLTNIAQKVSDLQMFTEFQLEAVKVLEKYGYWNSKERLDCLETIAAKTSDLQTFTEVFQDIVPITGLGTASGLMAISKDFQEFKINYHRCTAQIEWWGSDCSYLFRQLKNTSQVDQLLVFLETLAKNTRIAKYIQYTQLHSASTISPYISGALSQHKGNVFQICLNKDQEKEAEYSPIMDELIDKFEQDIINRYLNTIWWSSVEPLKLRWEFNQFTEYVPFELSHQNWAVDSDKNRSYWNWQDARGLEFNRFTNTLVPRLVYFLRQLDFSEVEILFKLLPNYLSIKEFSKTVRVPAKWEKGTEYQEGYNKWAGNYTEEIEVARPLGFVEHIFNFDRPDIQKAIELLDNMEKTREAIHAHRNSSR